MNPVGDDLVARLRSGKANTPGWEVTWVQNLREHIANRTFSHSEDWRAIFLDEVNSLLAAAEEAADRLEAQAAEIARLREALKPFAEFKHGASDRAADDTLAVATDWISVANHQLTIGDFRRARSTLESHHE